METSSPTRMTSTLVQVSSRRSLGWAGFSRRKPSRSVLDEPTPSGSHADQGARRPFFLRLKTIRCWTISRHIWSENLGRGELEEFRLGVSGLRHPYNGREQSSERRQQLTAWATATSSQELEALDQHPGMVLLAASAEKRGKGRSGSQQAYRRTSPRAICEAAVPRHSQYRSPRSRMGPEVLPGSATIPAVYSRFERHQAARGAQKR